MGWPKLGAVMDLLVRTSLAKRLADKWNRPYSSTISLLRTRFAISLVRSKNRCLRGARISTNKISYPCDWEDCAGLRFFSALE